MRRIGNQKYHKYVQRTKKQTLQVIDDLYKLIDDVKSSNYSLNEIAERIEEIRKKII